MASERIRQTIEQLLDEADAAAARQDWAGVGDLVERVLAVDPANEDALALRILSGAESGPSRAPPARAAGFVPEHLADEVRRIRAEVVGERRVVTVLFADAAGFTSLSETLDEEDVYALMQDCLSVMSDAVRNHDGTVTQFRGDGIMALFGAPIAHEDAAVKGVLAALEMRDGLEARRRRVDQVSGVSCRFRIGLNTGPVVVGSISEELEMDFTALGDTVNLAARMEEAAEHGSVWLTDTTRRAIEGYVVCEPRGEVRVRGKREALPAYEAIAPSGAATRFEAALARGLTSFVGREHELTVLGDFAEQAATGRAEAVLLVGEAGVGKSRLLLELRHRLGDDVSWLRGQCVGSGVQSPLLPLGDICRTWLGIDEGAPETEVTDRLELSTRSWGEDRNELVLFARYLLGLEVAELDGIDPPTLQARIVDLLEHIIADAAPRTVIVAIEDIHWLDASSAAVLSQLLDRRAVPALVVFTARPGYQHPLETRTDLARLVLEPLSSDQAAEIAENSTGPVPLRPEVAAMIGERTAGNPLYVEEFSRALVETGVIDAETGGLAAGVSPADVPTPVTVQDVILARIDRLSADAHEALQLASVIGREFSVRLLDRITELDDLDGSLNLLRTVELIRLTASSPEVSFMFKHALTHDVAYDTLLHARRRTLHGQVAAVIAELYRERLADYHSELARHYEAAENWREALPHLTAATERALATGAADSAIVFVERMDAIAERLGDPEIELMALEARAFVLTRAFKLPQARDSWIRCEQRATAAGKPAKAAFAAAQQAFVVLLLHDLPSLETALEHVRLLMEYVDDPDLVAEGAFVSSAALGVIGRTAQAHDVLVEAERAAAGSTPRIQESIVMQLSFLAAWRGDYQTVRTSDADSQTLSLSPQDNAGNATWTRMLSLIGRGDIEDAIAQGEAILERLTRGNEPFFRPRILNTIGWANYEVLNLDEAERWNRRSLLLAQEIELPDPEVESNARLNLCDIDLERGDLDSARVQLDWVGRVVADPGPADWFGLWRYTMRWRADTIRVSLIEGDLEVAASQARRLVDDAEENGSRKYVAIGHRLSAETTRLAGDHAAALASIDHATEVAETIGNPTQRWGCYAEGAALARASGDHQTADNLTLRAIDVIEGIAARLSPERRACFLAADRVSALTNSK